MIDDCILLVSSYDGGEDLWEGFFTCLFAEWPDFDMPIVLNTESKSYSFHGRKIETFNLYKEGQKVSWSKRLLAHLKRIDTEYVLFILDDFWLDAPVDTEHFNKCLNWMRENKDVANISFQRTHGENIKDNRFERFEKRPKKAEYKLNCQAALWRRERLIEFMRPHENPWEFEKYGSMRASRYPDSFYTLIDGAPKVFSYDLGGVLYKGRWHKDAFLPLVQKHNLIIDSSIRGFLEDWLANGAPRKRNLWRGIKNRINIIRSLI